MLHVISLLIYLILLIKDPCRSCFFKQHFHDCPPSHSWLAYVIPISRDYELLKINNKPDPIWVPVRRSLEHMAFSLASVVCQPKKQEVSIIWLFSLWLHPSNHGDFSKTKNKPKERTFRFAGHTAGTPSSWPLGRHHRRRVDSTVSTSENSSTARCRPHPVLSTSAQARLCKTYN